MDLTKIKSVFTKKRFITAISWISAQLLIVVFLAVFLLGALVTTTGGRNWLASTGLDWLQESDILAKQGLALNIDGFNYPETNHLTFSDLELKKDGALWVRIRDFDFAMELKPLWRKKFNVTNLSMAELYYRQLPAQPDETEDDDAEPSEGGSFALPTARLDRLAIDRLMLDGVIPESAHNPNFSDTTVTYKVEGNGYINGNDDIELHLSANPIEQNIPSLNVDITGSSAYTNHLVLAVQEPAKGWIGYWLKNPETDDLKVDLVTDVAFVDNTLTTQIESLKLPIAGQAIELLGGLSYQLPDAEDSAQNPNWELHTEDLLLKLAGSTHQIKADIINPQLDASVNINVLPLEIFSAWVPDLDNGTLTADVKVTETINAPAFDAEVKSDLRYADNDLMLRANATGTQERINVQQLILDYIDLNINADGTIDLANGNNDFEFKLTGLSNETIAPFQVELPEGLSFKVSEVSGQLNGTIDNPQADLILRARGQYKDLPFTTNAAADVKGDIVNIADLSLRLPDGHIEASGNVDYKNITGDINAEIKSIPLNIAEAVGVMLPEKLDGILNAIVTADGNLTQPNANIDATLSGHLDQTQYDFQLLASSQADRYQLQQLDADIDGNRTLSAKGSYQNDQFDAQLSITEFATAILAPLGVELPVGTINTDLSANGTAKQPVIDGSFEYLLEQSGYTAKGDKQPIPLLVKALMKTTDGELALNTTLERDGLPPGKLDLVIPLYEYINIYTDNPPTSTEQTPLMGNANVDLDLTAIAFLLDPEVNEIGGVVKAKLDTSGTLGVPAVDGDVNLTNFSYFNSLMGTQVEDFNCSLAAQKQSFTITECQGTDGDKGKYKIGGSLTLPVPGSYGAMDINIAAKNAEVIKRVDIDSQATGKIAITGDFNKLLASGNLEITPLNAMIDVNMGAAAPEIEVTEIAANETEEEESEPLFPTPTIELDLSITATQQAYLRGRGLETELSGEIKLSGTADDPQYIGEFNTLRGELELFGKDFQLEQGQVSFVNNSIAVAIEAVYEKSGNQIIADVSGQNDKYDIKFSSIPTMPQDEILSYIIFGESAADIEPIKAVQLAMAVKKLQGGSSSFDALGTARNLLGVDNITVENQADDENGDGGLNIGVGKYLNDRTYLELERTPNPSQPWKGSIQIELTPRIHLQSTTGGTSGIDSAEVIWEKDY
ncbi:translocation/assembly module TamB domain-containing protein [Halioxenophilus aromaticivorans]|uniref:Translocation and assembly module TamB C-terminal domain-containing protein n=1 Tax=Halioxenophilus aromaticivorans TaxID=1306992 RepID=A0AAV3TWW1_9ALTE